jgi:hypothetical protein
MEATDLFLCNSSVKSLLGYWWLQSLKTYGTIGKCELSKEEYRPFHNKLLMVMVQDDGLQKALVSEQLSYDDWKVYAEGNDAINYRQFEKALVALVAEWVETSNVEEFVQACRWLFFSVFNEHSPDEPGYTKHVSRRYILSSPVDNPQIQVSNIDEAVDIAIRGLLVQQASRWSGHDLDSTSSNATSNNNGSSNTCVNAGSHNFQHSDDSKKYPELYAHRLNEVSDYGSSLL